jgi:hypothetical protein
LTVNNCQICVTQNIYFTIQSIIQRKPYLLQPVSNAGAGWSYYHFIIQQHLIYVGTYMQVVLSLCIQIIIAWWRFDKTKLPLHVNVIYFMSILNIYMFSNFHQVHFKEKLLLFETIVLNFLHCPSLLKPLCFRNWVYSM